MSPNEAAQIVAVLVAAYPASNADEATATLWANALAPADYDVAHHVVLEVVRTLSWWPSIAEFNKLMTDRHRELARTGEGAPTTRITSALRCDSSGWIDRGDGLEPCPTCNPWLRTVWENGDLGEPHVRIAAPDDYVMPAPCRRSEHGRIVGRAEGARIALAAYRESCAETGQDPTPSIVASLERGVVPYVTTKEPPAA